MNFSEAVEGALEGLGKGAAAGAIVQPAVKEIATDMARAFVASGKEKVEDFLTTDDETNRLVMSGVALANEINSEIDWTSVPLDVMAAGLKALKVAVAVAAIF